MAGLGAGVPSTSVLVALLGLSRGSTRRLAASTSSTGWAVLGQQPRGASVRGAVGLEQDSCPRALGSKQGPGLEARRRETEGCLASPGGRLPYTGPGAALCPSGETGSHWSPGARLSWATGGSRPPMWWRHQGTPGAPPSPLLPPHRRPLCSRLITHFIMSLKRS